MIKLGERQTLQCVKKTDFGIYLGAGGEDRVLLPKKQVPEGISVGDELDVFIYRDSSDRLIATVKQPYINLGNLAVLKVPMHFHGCRQPVALIDIQSHQIGITGFDMFRLFLKRKQ